MTKRFRNLVKDVTLEMREVFAPTPLQRNEHLSKLYETNIWLKREDLSPVRSYKIRGAFNSIRKFRNHKHFVCASAGNHAQGVAFASKYFDVKATIFMPKTTPQQKITKTKLFGGSHIEIVMAGDYFDDCLAEAMNFSASPSTPEFGNNSNFDWSKSGIELSSTSIFLLIESLFPAGS